MGSKFVVVLVLFFGVATAVAAPATSPAPDERRPNVLIIGASSLTGLGDLLHAMLESRGIAMNIEERGTQLDKLGEMLKSKPVWDYVIMDAWHFGRGRTDAPAFPDAVTDFVKRVRAYSPNCKIILFAWWLPSPSATNADVMQVFHRCVEAAKPNHIWVATTGPAFTEARLARPDLQIVRSKTDAHPGRHGSYLNACSLFAAITTQTPVGLPATLKLPGRNADYTIATSDAKYLQKLAWDVYQRELKNVKPAD
ncbi:MAG TPA: hypothetical protein VLJ39_03990 [Tepidisphaeraceae bacterium]|nr:hypothetical protein [Tepidisphaeraceae bacterium]